MASEKMYMASVFNDDNYFRLTRLIFQQTESLPLYPGQRESLQ